MLTKNVIPTLMYEVTNNSQTLFLNKGADVTTLRGISTQDERVATRFPAGNYTGNYENQISYGSTTGLLGAYLTSNSYLNVKEFSDMIKSETTESTDEIPCSSGGYSGCLFGDGNDPVTFDDYRLSGNPVTGFTYTCADTWTYDTEYVDLQRLYTITNTSDESITIGEIGTFNYVCAYNANATRAVYMHYMVARTAFENPITIEPDGVGQVTYTLRFPRNYPIA